MELRAHRAEGTEVTRQYGRENINTERALWTCAEAPLEFSDKGMTEKEVPKAREKNFTKDYRE